MRSSLFFLSISIAAFFNVTSVYSQGRIDARVIDNQEESIEFVNFRLFSSSDSTVAKGVYSDSLGKIKLTKIPKGKYYGLITFFGYENKIMDSITISKRNQKVNLGTVKLQKEQSRELDEVVIKGETNIMESSIDKRTYNVGKDMTAVGGGVTEILNNIPSVEVDNDGNISLRGSQSVTILIDGRPSALGSGDGALDGIPASAIESIELITNPSAKYNPEGTAGIINIVLKKKKLRGMNTNVQLSAASEELYSGSVGFNMRNQNINFYANYALRYRKGFRNNFNERTSSFGDTTEFLKQDRLGTDFRLSHVAKIGADFYIKDNQVIGVSASGTYTDRIRNGKQVNYLSYNDELYQYWNRNVYDPRTKKSLDINANYKFDFKEDKGNIIIAATQSLGSEYDVGEFKEYYFRPDGSKAANHYRFQNQERTENKGKFTLSADLERKINKNMKYQAGLQAKINNELETNYLEYYDTISNQVIPDPNVNNELRFTENIFSAYGIFSQQLTEKLKYQAGLRLEQAYTEPRLVSTGESFENNYFSFFPSIHISFGEKEEGNLFTSYSRRINRPSSRALNPFPIYSDPLNLSKGNPEIQPEYINSFELGYERLWKNFSIMTTAYFKQTVNRIQRIRRFYDDGRSVTTYSNVDDSYDYGLELIGTYSPFSWWENMLSLNAYERRLSATVDGTDLSNKGISWDLKLNTTFSMFDNTTKIQINAQYIAPRYTVQGYYQRNPGIDVGFTRTLLDKRMVIGLRVSDIFNQKGFYFEINEKNVSQTTRYKWTTRRLYLTLSYKFGKIMKDKR